MCVQFAQLYIASVVYAYTKTLQIADNRAVVFHTGKFTGNAPARTEDASPNLCVPSPRPFRPLLHPSLHFTSGEDTNTSASAIRTLGEEL